MGDTASSEEERRQLHHHPPLGARALAAAIVLGDRDAVEKILDSGVTLAVLDDPTPAAPAAAAAPPSGCLHLLANHPEAVPSVLPLLLARGAKLDMRDEDGDTPLHRFVRSNAPQAVAALLARGADPNAANPRTGDTPLHVAARRKDEDMMALLIGLGAADETVANAEGVRPRDLHMLPEG